MRAVTSVKASLRAEGPLGAVGLRRAGVVLTSSGNLSGTVQLDEGGQLVDLSVILVKGALYAKGPTGGFERTDSGTLLSVYDPSAILNPRIGLAALLAATTNATTLGLDRIGSEDAYRIDAKMPGAALSRVVPGAAASGLVPVTVWIGKTSPQLLQVHVTLSLSSFTLTLSQFNERVRIVPPV